MPELMISLRNGKSSMASNVDGWRAAGVKGSLVEM